MLTSQRQGDLGEASALEWLVSLERSSGCSSPSVARRTTTSSRRLNWAIVPDPGQDLAVQDPKRNKQLGGELETRGGNQSWRGTVEARSSPSRCDFVFVVLVDGRRWFIPSAAISARRTITVGGVAYRSFEVEPGRPLAEDARSPPLYTPRSLGGVPKRSNGADCKRAGSAFTGSNPVPTIGARRPPARLCRPALVAQLVEHFHGKEGVSGSSPDEGLAKDQASGRRRKPVGAGSGSATVWIGAS